MPTQAEPPGADLSRGPLRDRDTAVAAQSQTQAKERGTWLAEVVVGEGEAPRARQIPLDELLLDPNNGRLIEDPLWQPIPDENVALPEIQEETAQRLVANAALNDLVENIRRFGWLDVEPVRARALPDGRLLVVDGNRRVLALRMTQAPRSIEVLVDGGVGGAPPLAQALRHTFSRALWPDLSAAIWESRADVTLYELWPRPWSTNRFRERALELCVRFRQGPLGEHFRSEMFQIVLIALSRSKIREWLEEPGNFERFFSWMVSPKGDSETPDTRKRAALTSPSDALYLEPLLADPEALARLDEGEPPRPVRRARSPRDREPSWTLTSPERAISLSSLHIRRYRGLSELSLPSLGRINLLVGVNNVGKTSLLESIYLLCRQADPRGLVDIVRSRLRSDPEAQPAQLVRLLPKSGAIEGISVSGPVHVEHTLSSEPPGKATEIATFLAALRIEATSPDRQISLTEIHSDRARSTHLIEGSRRWLAQAVLHSPFSLSDPDLLARCYERSIESGTKREIVSFIQEHVDADVSDIELASTDGRFLVTHRRDGALDLSSYGEGMQRIFQVGLLFAAHARGIVLVDELENALHTSVLGAFSRLMQDLAVRFDVQVFLTTHSKEAADAFVLNEYRTDDIVAFVLRRKEDQRIEATRYGGAQYKRAVEVGDVDLRRL